MCLFYFLFLSIFHTVRFLSGAADIRAKKKSEAFDGDPDDIPLDPTQIDFGVKEIPRYLKDIFTNWSFVCIAIYICCDMGTLCLQLHYM